MITIELFIEDGEERSSAIIWQRNGCNHRLDGPAVIFRDGEYYWYEYGKYIGSSLDDENKD